MGHMNLTNVSIDQLLSTQEAAEHSGLSDVHLRRLVRLGKVAGVRLGRLWFTTAEAVDAYLAQGHRPGPKPKRRTKTRITSQP